MPRKTQKKAQPEVLQKRQVLGTPDSYKSLLYGVATVVILFIIGFGMVKLFVNRPKPEIDNQAVSIQNLSEPTPTVQAEGSPAPTKYPVVSPTPTDSQPTPTPTAAPTKVAKAPTATPTIVPTKAATPTPQPKTATKTKGVHIVKTGESLWDVAVAEYKDGYKWTQIAEANNLANPGVIFKDDKLVIPAEVVTPTPAVAMVNPEPSNNSQMMGSQASPTAKIKGNSYVVQHGDDLWHIAERAYGDGSKWAQIAEANNLSDPNLIFSDNFLKLPR